jgi:hypothetical protein
MRELRTVHTMDVRGSFVLRHSSQTCQSHVRPHRVVARRVLSL